MNLDELKKITDEIVSFSEFICGRKLYNYQIPVVKRICSSLLYEDGEEITVLFARQSGKTEAVALIVCGLCVILPKLAQLGIVPAKFCDGIWIGMFAPTSPQVDIIFNRCKSFISTPTFQQTLKDRELQLTVDKRKTIIKFSNKSIITISSADPSANIEGTTYHFIVVDESQDVTEYVYRKSIIPMLTATNGTIVRLGTTNGEQNDFLRSIERNIIRDKNINDNLLKNHFEYDYRTCIKVNENYKKFIEKQIELYGEDDPYFRMSYCLDRSFGLGTFITEDQFEAMLDKKKGLISSVDDSQRTIVAGIDFAKSIDKTVVTVYEIVDDKKILLNWLSLKETDYETQFYLITDFLKNYKGLERVALDATGPGKVMIDRFNEYFMENDIISEPIDFSRKMKSNLYKYYYNEIVSNRIIIPADMATMNTIDYRNFKKEHINLLKEWKNGLLIVKHGGKNTDHDDYTDSSALAIWTSQYLISINTFDDINLYDFKKKSKPKKSLLNYL